jgi:hypothetical protein
LPGTEPDEKIQPAKDPPMLSDSRRISIAKSETRQAAGSDIPQLIQGAVNAASPAWQRLESLVRGELHRESEGADD